MNSSQSKHMDVPTLVGSGAACSTGSDAQSRGLRPGLLVSNRYRVGALLGSGGMGLVYEAEHVILGQTVALKVLRPELIEQVEYVTRFVREARWLARMRGEHVVRILDAGRLETGLPYLVMERLYGLDLQALLRKSGQLPERLVVDYAMQACAGLMEVHAAGLIHRDIKPSNLFLASTTSGRGGLKLLDFGIAREASSRAIENEALGSASYASPEQARSPSDVDARSDIWSLGMVLFELLAGKLPDLDEQGVPAHVHLQLQVCRPEADPALVELISGCLSFRRSLRFSCARELAEALAPLARRHARSTAEIRERRSTSQGSRPLPRSPLQLSRARSHTRSVTAGQLAVLERLESIQADKFSVQGGSHADP